MAATSTMTCADTNGASDSAYLSTSLSSLSRSRSTNSLIVRTYKEATQLYLTKRFAEALEILETIIKPHHDPSDQANGSAAAPVAQSSRGTRTKVWVFYLSLLHAIIELGPEEGKLTFGSTRWKQLAAAAREGSIWEEIVQSGYGGEPGAVDADVVVNLSTLLLTHMASQKLNQERLETWLSASETQLIAFADGIMSPGHSDTPKALATRLKVLELYALHVLPANGEWDYAREFIENSDSLDDERREAFLQALEQAKEEKEGTAERERELQEMREKELEEQRAREAEERREAERAEKRRMKEEHDRKVKAASEAAAGPSRPAANGTADGRPASADGQPNKPATRPMPKGGRRPPPSAAVPRPATLYGRASSALNELQQMVLGASRSMTGGGRNSFAIFRFLMFLVAFLVIVARQDVRVRLKRLVEDGWGKVKKTVGMGVKVSYI